MKNNTLSNINLCFVNSCKTWGGGEKWHFSTACVFANKYNVSIITNKRSELFNKAKGKLAVKSIKISNLSFLNPFKLYQLFTYFRRNKINSVILNLPSDVKCAGIAAKLAGVNKIVYRRGMPNPIKNSFLNRFLFKYVISDVIANSIAIKRSITTCNSEIFPSENINVIYNSVDISSFTCINYKVKNVVTLGCAGRLVEQKNQKILIPMIKNIVNAGFNVELLIAGKGPLEDALNQLVKQHSMEKYIRMVGFKKDIQSFLDEIDVFLFPSLYEGSANILIEVMAKGIPTVTFNRSSMPEMIIDSHTGLLVNSEAEFEEAIIALLNSIELRIKLGQGARKFVVEHLNDSNIYKQIAKVIC